MHIYYALQPNNQHINICLVLIVIAIKFLINTNQSIPRW